MRPIHNAELDAAHLPEFGIPKTIPTITAQTYLSRLNILREIALKKDYAVFVIYGDREHYANISWFTGYDPRFEEALLVIDLKEEMKPLLMVGNEGLSYVNISPILKHLQIKLFQSFSLPEQPRGNSKSLDILLRLGGVKRGRRIGLAGWKYYTDIEFEESERVSEVPSYIVDTIRKSAGTSNVYNASNILTNPTEGIRVVNDIDQLAYFEYISTITSQAVRDLLFGIRLGMTEYDAIRLMKLNGIPLSCHIMFSTGQRATMGLSSPSSRVIQKGDPFTLAYGSWGSLTARAGFIAVTEKDLPPKIKDYVEVLVASYFEAVASWYRKLRIGVTGSELYNVIHEKIGEPFFGVHLNPGHLISLEEWLCSPIYKDSVELMKSGMALQVDIIPATGSHYHTTNIEDTIALADIKLRKEFQERYPEAWERIQKRRQFMINELGIELNSEVLPFSNIPAYLPPFILSPNKAMRLKH